MLVLAAAELFAADHVNRIDGEISMPRQEEEMVLVVPKDRVPLFQGFLPTDRQDVLKLTADGRYMPRSLAETDEDYKQIIPYAIMMAGGRIFHYRRGVKGGESRLFGLISVGVGGHVSSVDSTLFGETYDVAFERELAEEVVTSPILDNSIRGLINDDSNPVGRVHLGVVHLLRLKSPEVRSAEKALIDCGFSSVEELLAEPGQLETWSRICLDNWPHIG